MSDDVVSPSQIRRQRFEMVRRGFDPQEVGAFLERVADRLAFAERAVADAEARLSSTSTELDDARAAEEALQLTMVAATQAKDEMLARAGTQAEEIRLAAQREAEAMITEARRQASTMVGETKREAGGVVSAASVEHAELLGQVEQLRAVVGRVRGLLASVAGTVDPTLEDAERMLADPSSADLTGAPPRVPAPQAVAVHFEPGEADDEGQPAPVIAADAAPWVEEADVEEAGETIVEPADEPEVEDVAAVATMGVAEQFEPDPLDDAVDLPPGPPLLEVVAAVDDDETDDGADGQSAEAVDDGADDEAAEVERLLRQLRGG